MEQEFDRRRDDAIGLDQALAAAVGSDKPSMGDPEFVEGKLRDLGKDLADIRKAYNEATGADAHIKAAKDANEALNRFSADLAASNTAYQQTLSPEGQKIWLQQRGYDGIGAVIGEFGDRILKAIIRHEEEEIDDDQLQFEIEAAVEDATALVMGVDAREPDTDAE